MYSKTVKYACIYALKRSKYALTIQKYKVKFPKKIFIKRLGIGIHK